MRRPGTSWRDTRTTLARMCLRNVGISRILLSTGKPFPVINGGSDMATCLVCEGGGELYPSGMCGGCDAERMDAEARGYAVRVGGNGRVFCASDISLSLWNGFVRPSFSRIDAECVLEDMGMSYAFSADGWTLFYIDTDGETVTVSRTRDGLYPVGAGSWTWERVEVNA